VSHVSDGLVRHWLKRPEKPESSARFARFELLVVVAINAALWLVILTAIVRAMIQIIA
jgi:hypothetical protein